MALRFTPRTLAELARVLSRVIQTHGEMDQLYYEYAMQASDPGRYIRERANRLVFGIVERNADAPHEAEADLLQLLRYIRQRAPYQRIPAELQRRLAIDGFEVRDDDIVPTTPAPAQLGPELTALEADLQALGLNVASTHYRQAHEAYVAGNWEPCNGSVRSFLEDLVKESGRRRTGHSRNDAMAALQDLRNAGRLDKSEWNLVRAFWGDIQDNGPHSGLSDEQEALFRLHTATALARYLLHKGIGHAPP